MEGDLWFYCGKYQSSSSSASSFSSSCTMKSSDLLQGGENIWEYFLCPFCYVEVEVQVLCTHLREEHCFETANAVCPLCAANTGKDMIGHFSAQHSNMLKRRKSQKTSLQPRNSATVEEESHEANSYYEALLKSSRRTAPDPAPDPLLSSFICNEPFPDSKDDIEVNSSFVASTPSMKPHEQRPEPSANNETMAKDYEEMCCRAEFVQQLILSTIVWS
ncbi:hypothetical protein HPP92_023049 [Vanilla planifolia]|uniref:Drought induced 19 protein type zinc-binding domain-containing protein n=1 Tax=Vanilla planifolia TaxID=51239 RepID=A0A835PRC3_VANPL|nr:hypothetical protein HPP92_023366 [Vanilla planifolia]KAG0459921.1 hypothetical protein HPP92_023049 [Vanilla planifolia]